jgi:pre-mRNA-splicing factor SYF2
VSYHAELFSCSQAAEARGEDFDRIKSLNITAEDAERKARKRKKPNPDTGFAGT